MAGWHFGYLYLPCCVGLFRFCCNIVSIRTVRKRLKAKMSKMEQDILNSKCALLANSALVIMENQYIQDSDNRLSVINEIYQRAVGAFEELLQKFILKRINI